LKTAIDCIDAMNTNPIRSLARDQQMSAVWRDRKAPWLRLGGPVTHQRERAEVRVDPESANGA